MKPQKNLLIAMEKAGADLIEIGIPFSDPIAEGPVIQEASQRALAAGCTTDKLFDMVKEARQRVKIPMVFMTYINPVYTYGKERFMKRCVECGIDGIIVPDLPYEEKEELSGVCESYGIDLISLIAPTSHERIRMIAKEAKGFVYCVSSLGVTGVRSEIKTDVAKMVEMVKEVNDIPAAIGFGISTPEQAKKNGIRIRRSHRRICDCKNCGEVRKRMYSGSRKICERDESGSGDLNVQMNEFPEGHVKVPSWELFICTSQKARSTALQTPRFFRHPAYRSLCRTS